MSDIAWAIEIAHLSKCFHSGSQPIQALSDVSFNIPQGTVFCILGHNGAGKTTLLRILTTVIRPDSGSAKILGHDIQRDIMNVRQHIGIVAQSNNFDRYLTIWQNLALHAQMHGMTAAEYKPRLKELLEQVGLYERRDGSLDELSGGLQRRVALIRALIHKPKILFLDEPTTGLDPEARRDLWETIEQFKAFATVILTTHYLEEADMLSDQILILNHGKVVMSGSPEELKKTISPQNTYDIKVHDGKAAYYHDKLQAAGFPDIQVFSKNNFRIQLQANQTLKDVLNQMQWEDIQQVGETEVDLETVYLTVSGS